MKRLALFSIFCAGLCMLVGCGKKGHDHAHDHSSHSGHGHHHEPPHGGTPVVLGNEAFHLEFVQDPEAGTLTAYVLDAHMEKFVRIGEPSLQLEATFDGKTERLALMPVANTATDETVGDTSQFQASAEWLKRVRNFEAKLTSISVRGSRFENVTFNFPKGNER
jgi:hypothetical protein